MKTLWLLVVGGRDFLDHTQLFPILDGLTIGYDKIVVVSGGANGTDYLAELWANKHEYEFHEFKANWDAHGRAAGPIRNREMAAFVKNKECKLVVCVWDGKSKGTSSMIDIARQFSIPTKVFKYNEKGEIDL